MEDAELVTPVLLMGEITQRCACGICCTRKGLPCRNHASLQSTRLGVPLNCVAVDIADPLLTTSRNHFVCVITDYVGWVEAYALSNHEDTAVAELLVEQFFFQFGVPAELH